MLHLQRKLAILRLLYWSGFKLSKVSSCFALFSVVKRKQIRICIQTESIEEVLYVWVCACVLMGQVWRSLGKVCTDGDGKEKNFCMSDKWNTNNNNNLVVPHSGYWIFCCCCSVMSACCLIWKWSLFLQPLNMWAFLCIGTKTNDLFCNYFSKGRKCVCNIENGMGLS